MLKHLPNFLTSLRLGCAPVIAYGITNHWNWSTIVPLVVFGYLTDGLDGWLAKSNNWQSQFGKGLDPFADKALFFSILVASIVTFYHQLPVFPLPSSFGWLDVLSFSPTFWLITTIELVLIVFGGPLYWYYKNRGVELGANIFGQWKTRVHAAAMFSLLVGIYLATTPAINLSRFLFLIAIPFGLASIIKHWVDAQAQLEEARSPTMTA